MQSDKNSRNAIYIKKEQTHNFTSLFFSIIGTILLLVGLMFSVVENNYVLITYTSLFILFNIIRIIINIKVSISFRHLVKKIAPEEIEFYISKSWTRKRAGSIWVGIIFIFTSFMFLITASFLTAFTSFDKMLTTGILIAIHLFIVIIYMFTSVQTLDAFLKISEKRLNLSSLEWLQIKKDQKNFYKLLFIWYVHAIFIIPLFFMVVPKYREAIYKTLN